MKKIAFLASLAGVLAMVVLASGRLFEASDPLRKTDVVVPLRGSAEEERLRLDEAAKLVRDGYAPTLLVSVQGGTYYGQSVRALVAAYLSQTGFPKEAVRFCENTADSTIEEARALLDCLQPMGAREVMIVTSDYHSRRARWLAARAFGGSGIHVYVHPVYNSNYWSASWWRRRRWAKTFVIEALSWIGNAMEQSWSVFRVPPGSHAP